ncbi:helix-turn-helix transcriptional regulator [Desulfallas thermosapovorans]|uniref:Putative DNA-binding transcriptional regulator YafY n=1 Tax=Desulfallas thermosapovorans DSM 6562 TaxID=1121431 RepID=A0A5S4ZMX5_9FIRM|nr:WYL domain-containing protein [Desulfallas thermosapovorans]TYO92764.1 putative DNA-binding transcriptional regulator YafY [Desulfallas thermosapovorans DSM 6562]
MHEDTLVRLNKLLTLLGNHPEGLSAREAARLTGYPAGVLLDDLNRMAETVELAGYYPLYSDDDGAAMSSGHDELDVRWYLSGAEPFPPFNLHVSEAVALLWLLDHFPHAGRLKELREKLGGLLGFNGRVAATPSRKSGKYGVPPAELKKLLAARGGTVQHRTPHLDLLREAVLRPEVVCMTYYARSDDALWQDIDVYPLGLVYFTETGIWYLVGRRLLHGENMVFHLGRVKKVSQTGKKFTYPEDFSLRHYLAPRWGMDMSPPVRVKVRFYDEAGVLEKVRSEFARRGLAGLRAEPGGTLLFEGEVYGYLYFSRWLLGFGSSVEVLAPEELRRRMIAVARHWYAYGRKR